MITITKQGKENMEKLIAYVRTVPPENFDMGRIRERKLCGTVGCLMGYTPDVFPDNVVPSPVFDSITWKDWGPTAPISGRLLTIAQYLFGINREVAASLFYCRRQAALGLPTMTGYSTPNEACDMLEAFLKLATVAN